MESGTFSDIGGGLGQSVRDMTITQSRRDPTIRRSEIISNPRCPLSISDYLESWLSGKAVGTKEAYKRIAVAFEASLPFSIASLCDIKRPYITQYIDKARASVGPNGTKLLTENSVRFRVAVLKSLFRYLTEQELIPRNPTLGLKSKQEEEPLSKRILKRDEMLRIISCGREGREKALITVLYHTGMRVSECISMTWENLRYHEKGGDIAIVGKGGSKRMVTLRADDLQLLRDLNPDEKGFMFFTRTGAAISRTEAHRHMKSACKRSGLNKPVSCHWCRHAMISHSIRGGQGRPPKSISVVGRDVGHKTRAMTLRYDRADDDEPFSGLDL
jgi:integrase/recombinase XerD